MVGTGLRGLGLYLGVMKRSDIEAVVHNAVNELNVTDGFTLKRLISGVPPWCVG